MSLITVIVILIVLGIVLQLIRSWLDPTIYRIILVLIVLAVCLMILSAFGLFSMGGLELR
jgi:hypothetical protein